MDDQNESFEILINKWYTTNNNAVNSKIPPLEEITLPTNGRMVTASLFQIKIINTKDGETSSFLKE